MSWMGKIIGGGLGMALGGPLGAIIGASLGHSFVDSKPGGAGRVRLSTGETKQMVFFATTFAMLGKMAKADGRVSKEEIQVVERFIQERIGLDSRARELAIKMFNEGKDAPTPFGAFAKQFGEVFAQEHQMRVMLYELLFTLAMADGTLHAAEDQLLREALGPLRLETSLYDELHGKTPDHAHLYSLLGVTQDATDDELKRAYRKAAHEFHPDKVIAKGLPEEFTKFAEEKFREVNQAYETLKEHRGQR